MHFIFKPEGHGLKPKLRWTLCSLSTILEKALKYLSIYLASKAARFLIAHFWRVPVCQPL